MARIRTDEPEFFLVRNWKKFQHYTDRNPPWIKLHFELLASEDWVMLDDASRVLAVACMLIASRNQGQVPNKPDYIKRVAYLNKPTNFIPLIECGFLEIPLADASTLLAGCKRMQADARPETESETESESEKKESSLRSGFLDENDLLPPPPQTTINGKEISAAFLAYNEVAARIGLPIARQLDDARRTAIKRRLIDHGPEGWTAALRKLEESPHCRGENDRGWRADLDFVCRAKSFNKLIEGSFSNRRPDRSRGFDDDPFN